MIVDVDLIVCLMVILQFGLLCLVAGLLCWCLFGFSLFVVLVRYLGRFNVMFEVAILGVDY